MYEKVKPEYMKPDNDSNFNMIINREIFKNLIESFMKCQISDSGIGFSIDIRSEWSFVTQ